MMDIKTLADIGKIADICRKKGIESIKITEEGVEFRLGEKPEPKKRLKAQASAVADKEPEIYGALTEQDVLMWSSGQEA